MSIPLNYTREKLIEALEATRPAAVKADAEATREHKKAEQLYLKRFREALRGALKWTYEEAKAQRFEIPVLAKDGESGRRRSYYRSDLELDRPSCPTSRVSQLDRVLSIVRTSQQTRFHVQDSGKYRQIYNVLTADMPEAKGLC